MRAHVGLTILTVLLLAGCAGVGESIGTIAPAAKLNDPSETAKIPAAANGYKLTDLEQKLDCPKLTGQMRVRMATMRDDYAVQSGTTTSRTLQSVVTPVMGGSVRGKDPIRELQLDRARLEAFNTRLAEKNCAPLDLDAELRGEPPSPAAGKPIKAK